MPINQTGSNAQAIIGIYNDVALSNYITNQITDIEELKRIQSIQNVPRAEAAHCDYETKKRSGPCFEGTREALLQDIGEWFIKPGESRIYVLSGLAGIGKSTVAYTIAERAYDFGLLGASFFFSRDEANRNNAKRFFTTLAFQLCTHDAMFAHAIGSALLTERGSAATTKDPQEQLRALILDPLQKMDQSAIPPILIVVDALDECDEDDGPSVIVGLGQLVRNLPSFKVLLTTRPQPRLNYTIGIQDDHKIFHLQDIEAKVVDGDIWIYLEHSLSMEKVQEQLGNAMEQWYASDKEIGLLVQAAGRLFIIASTTVLFILDKFVADPAAQMEKLLRAFAEDHTPLRLLNNFYSVIVGKTLPGDRDDDIVERYQSVVGAIMVIQTPLPIMVLARLIDMNETRIRIVLRNLQSVILLGSDNIPRAYHKSFFDYITDSTRCKDIDLRINPTVHHTRIAIHCFRIMDGRLRYNILGLGSPARFMANEEGLAHQGILDGQLEENIPSELRYACVYWANHLENASIEDAGLMREITKFADNHMLHWFEVLSLIGKLDSAHNSIRVALRLVKPTSSDLFPLLSDGLRFISRFYQLIRKSALHTYYSALPFAPTSTLLYNRYQREAVNGICRVTGGPEQWDALVVTQEHGIGHEVHVQCSHDSAMFASQSRTFNVHHSDMKIWDAATGTPISILLPTSLHVSIANDFSVVASANDNGIALYSVKGSTPLATFTASTRIRKLALSSESRRVATWLLDGTICLWDTGNGAVIASFSGFAYHSALLRFSPTGARLIFVPDHGGIQLRDGITGELVTNTHDPSNWRCNLVFSNDGSRFGVLARNAVTLWESESGQLTGVVKAYPSSTQFSILAISTNGSLLATYDHKKLKVWSKNNGNPLALIEEQGVSSIFSMAFSPEDMLAVGTSGKITLHDVRNHSVISVLSVDWPISLSFSPDCTRLAAISGRPSKGTLNLWDVQNIKASGPSSTEEAVRALGLAFSQDDARLACRLNNGAVVLFDVATERVILIHDLQNHKEWVLSFGFSPDGGKLAASFGDGIVRLWDSKDGASIGSVRCSWRVAAMALSDRLLAVAGSNGKWSDEIKITLWDLRTLNLVGTIKQPDSWFRDSSSRLLFSNNGDLIALYKGKKSNDEVSSTVTVMDVMKRTAITTFRLQDILTDMAFLPDNSRLTAQLPDGSSQSLNIVSNEVTRGPTFNHPNQCIPLWNGIPVWILPQDNHLGCNSQPRCLLGSFSQHKDPVPVLWIPVDLQFQVWAQGSSTIALACKNGKVIFIRSSSDHLSANFSLASLAH